MKSAITVVHMTLRASGLLLILLGLSIWTGRADPVIPIHETLGFILVLSLWTLAFFAARGGVAMGWVALAVAWGLIAPILGLTPHWRLALDHPGRAPPDRPWRHRTG